MSDDAIKHFVDVTGSSVEDAIKYLSICDNNVSLAVECFVDQQPQNNALGNIDDSRNDKNGRELGDAETDVRAPIASKTDRIVEEHVRVGRVGKRPANAFDFQGERDFSGSHYSNPLAKKKMRGIFKIIFISKYQYCHSDLIDIVRHSVPILPNLSHFLSSLQDQCKFIVI